MNDLDDYYARLGLSRNPSANDIKKAYLDKCFILHPDRMHGVPESAKKRAEQELVVVNRAYDILKDQQKRKAYDAKRFAHENKPKPTVEPSIIQFKEMCPGETRSASFVINNNGGQYSKIWISNPDTWVQLAEYRSLSTSDELPLQVNIKAVRPENGKTLSENIKVRLDDEETHVTAVLKTQNDTKSLLSKIFKSRLQPTFSLKDHDWHDYEYKNLPAWIKTRIYQLKAGEELIGKLFRYRYNSGRDTYQICLKDNYERGTFHKPKKLIPPVTFSDHDWHDIEYKYLMDWVKKQKDRLNTGEILFGKYYDYRKDPLSGSSQIRLKRNHKRGTYRR